jgi:hypothetical protein
MMARRECRHREDHLDETGYSDADVARPLGVVLVSQRQEEATRVVGVNVSASANVNVTMDECAQVHGLPTHLRDPSQRDAPRSSERVRHDSHARAESPHHEHDKVRMNGCACDHEHREHGSHDRGHGHAHADVRGYENDHDARDHPLPACQKD